MTLSRIGVAALLAGVLAFVAGAAGPESASGLAAQLREEGITVTGTGVVRAVPDRAELSFGVQTSGRTATQALAANSAEMRKVIDALVAAGVARADLQTQQISLQPRYSDDGGEILGYVAQNSVAATLRDLDRAGAVIDAAVAAGANQVFGPALSRSDQTELYRNALRAGIADARAKAETIAAAAGLGLAAVVAVEEMGSSPPPVPLAARTADAAGPPVEPGTQEIQATVVVRFSVT
jgi:hypothetical protein